MIETLILSIVQGITEFLPISSSSHLILISKFWLLGGRFQVFGPQIRLQHGEMSPETKSDVSRLDLSGARSTFNIPYFFTR